MTAQEQVLTKLANIEARSAPSSFDALFSLVTELCDAAAALRELEHDALVHLLERFWSLGNLLTACIAESFAKGLLNDVQRSGELETTPIDDIAIAVERALHIPTVRALFLEILIQTSGACVSCFLLTLGRDETSAIGWISLMQSVRAFPFLARVALKLDCEKMRQLALQTCESGAQRMKEQGYEFIDPAGAVWEAEEDAWGAWTQAATTRGQERLSLLQECSAKLAMAASFLLLVETSPWTVGPFYKLREGASMTAIVGELNHKKLQRVSSAGLHGFFFPKKQVPVDHAAMDEVCVLAMGVLRKTRYIVRLPPPIFFREELSHSAIVEWRSNPVEFMQRNLQNIPRSVYARKLMSQTDKIEREVFDAQLEESFSHAVEELTPEVLALLAVESTGLPHATTVLLTPLLRRLFRLLQAH